MNITRKEFDKIVKHLSEESRDFLWKWMAEHENTSVEMIDYSNTCSMCGKPMPSINCGMCTKCEQIYNS